MAASRTEKLIEAVERKEAMFKALSSTVPAAALLAGLLSATPAQAAGAPISSVQSKGISSSHEPVGGVVINPDGRWNHTHSSGVLCNEDDNISVRINLVDSYTTNYYTYHYFYTPRTGWVGSGWLYHSAASSNEWVLKYAFKQGEVIQTCGFTWKDGVQSSQVNGPTITVAQATVNAPKGYINSYLWVLKYLGKGVTKGFELPWSEVISWAEPWVLDNLAIAAADIRVVDQDGNPLQSYMLPPSSSGSYVRTYSFLGQVHVTNVTNATATNAVLYDNSVINVTQPNGTNWNFLGVAAQVNLAKYNYRGTDATHPWGKAVSRIPMVSVVFDKSGALQVNYPQPYSWDEYYEANAPPASPWTSSAGTSYTANTDGTVTIGGVNGNSMSHPSVGTDSGGVTFEFRLKQVTSRLEVYVSNGTKQAWVNIYPGLGCNLISGVWLNDASGARIDVTKYHTYRVTLKNGQAQLYVDAQLVSTMSSYDRWGWVSVNLNYGLGGGTTQLDYFVLKNGSYAP